jgi:acyl-coenzyme A thioesterase PaaI-like protein
LLYDIRLYDTLTPGQRWKAQYKKEFNKVNRTMELNDTTDYQRCFACGQRNPNGLHLVFRLENNTVVADFQPREEHQGFPGVIHGGIVAAVLDEALGRTSMLTEKPQWSMTGRIEVRYRRYVPFGPLLRIRTSLETERSRMVQASGKLTLADDESVILAEAHGTFLYLSNNVVDTVLKDFPALRGFLEH